MEKRIASAILMVTLLPPMAIASYGAERETTPAQTVRHSFLCSDVGAGHVFKFSAEGKVEWEYPADQCTDAWMLAGGNILMSFTDSSGKMIREIKVPDLAFSMIRLENGNTVIGYRGGVVEVDPKDEVVWHLTQEDLPDVKLYWICSVQRLPNGNTVVGNWFIHQRRTDSTPFFEVTPDKTVVWRAEMHERMFDPVAIQILDVEDTTLR